MGVWGNCWHVINHKIVLVQAVVVVGIVDAHLIQLKIDPFGGIMPPSPPFPEDPSHLKAYMKDFHWTNDS